MTMVVTTVLGRVLFFCRRIDNPRIGKAKIIARAVHFMSDRRERLPGWQTGQQRFVGVLLYCGWIDNPGLGGKTREISGCA